MPVQYLNPSTCYSSSRLVKLNHADKLSQKAINDEITSDKHHTKRL